MTDREALARIIDPTSFALAAEVARLMDPLALDRPPGSTMSVASELAKQQCAAALAKADAWLSRPSPVDKLTATLTRLEGERDYTWDAMTNAQAYMRAETSNAIAAEARAEAAEAENARLREALSDAAIVVSDLLAQWPDGSVPSAPLCVRAADVINTSLTGDLTNAQF